jgi:hypothetical protein
MTNTQTIQERADSITAVVAAMNAIEKQISKARKHDADVMVMKGYEDAHKHLRWLLEHISNRAWLAAVAAE